MGATFVVTLREAFEAALLLGIVYTYLDKIGASRHANYVTRGALLGVVASLLMGLAVSLASGPLLDLGPDLVGAVVILVAVVVLTWHGWWMRQHARALTGTVEQRLADAHATRRWWIFGLIAFTGVFREGAETVLFMWGLLSQAAQISAWGGLLGAVLGIGTAAVLGWAIFHGGRRVRVSTFFSITSVLLFLVAAGLFSTGVGKLETLGVLPATGTAWDTSFLLDDSGVVGGFLGGLVGYRARPLLLEVAGYALYLVVVGWLLFGASSNRRSRPATVSLTPAVSASRAEESSIL